MSENCGRPEIWGGIECTINRLRSGYFDQLAHSGHYTREDDIDAICSLGIKSLRYPILWEKHQPRKNSKIDFPWASKQLERIRTFGVKPVIGLLHHGSGPQFTNLLDDKFPNLFAEYASKVAAHFPWVDAYTPINEPLTTARFSGLYGIWYPHETNDVSFARMFLNQMKAIVLSMREIRKVNPDAKLIQTEDLGKTYSTPLLRYQAEWENLRRWLTWDVLCGKLTREHRFWEHFTRLGIPESDLQFFCDNPCPPDLIGVNHYVTSERYLDENLHKYPSHTHGGNTIHNYADVEAVRINLNEPSGFSVVMRELWERFQIPIAVTEAHLHCSREEQMKWFSGIYDQSCKLKEDGIDVRAVTAWSLLGAFGWNKLLTDPPGTYERGAFDISSGQRRPTAMATLIRELATKGEYENPLLRNEGWWTKESRFYGNSMPIWGHEYHPHGQPIMIVGKTGTLGRAFSRICSIRSLHHVLLGRDEIDITDWEMIRSAVDKYKPWAVINAAGYVRVDDAENDCGSCFLQNTTGAVNLSQVCRELGIRYMAFSSDLVFDGTKSSAYVESDATNPLNIYGRSKAEAEKSILKNCNESLIIRTSAFFGPWDKYNFVHAVLDRLSSGDEFHASSDVVSPTFVPHLVNASLDLLIDGESGLWHLANDGAISWFDFAIETASRASLNTDLIKPLSLQLPAKRPSYSALSTEKCRLMPSLDEGLDQYFREVYISGKVCISV